MATEDAFYPISWGGMRLWCLAVETDSSRDLVIHQISAGNKQTVQQRGRRIQKTRCTLLWDDVTGETDSPIKRFRAFQAQVAAGNPQLFSHPIDGSYVAVIGENTYGLAADDNTVTNHIVEFVANDEVISVNPVTAGVAAATGADAVGSAADELDAVLESVDLDSGATDIARAATTLWANGDADGNDIPARQILVDVANISDLLGDEIETGGYEDDLLMWPAWRSTILLGDTVRAAALAAMAEVPSVFVVTVGLQPISLLRLCMQIYGGREAEERYRQVMALNDIKRPAWLDAGSQIVMPQRAVSPRSNLARSPT